MEARRVTKITDRAVVSLLSHCKLLCHLDVCECASITPDAPTLAGAVLNRRHVYITWPAHVYTDAAPESSHNDPATGPATGAEGSSAMADLAKMLMSQTTSDTASAPTKAPSSSTRPLMRSSSATR